DFWKTRLAEKHGIEVLIPDERERQIVHRTIYEELCVGRVRQSSKEEFRRIIQNLIARGAEGIVLGCTEIYLLVEERDVQVPVFDTTTMHARAAAWFALER
ncbi:MAG: aspartate/glutamate racemase family protein, partial [Phycisphaerales bacterium]